MSDALVTAAGKTTVADALGSRLGALRLTTDDFHRPPPHEYYPETRYLEEVDPAALADVVIDSTEPDRLRLVRG